MWLQTETNKCNVDFAVSPISFDSVPREEGEEGSSEWDLLKK